LKKILLFGLLFHCSVIVFSQQRIISATETIIGTTTYDLQTNGTISNRLLYNSDGSMCAVWSMSLTGNSVNLWPDRGTGYNYFDPVASSWSSQPSNRIEPYRT